jgi:acyl-CoA reductase-like NAD-dependent aldehyde dehydrogenase
VSLTDRLVARVAGATADEVVRSRREADTEGLLRADVERLLRADADVRRVEINEMRRILADQSDALDDTNEVFGRVLARLTDDVQQLRTEVAGLRAELRRARTPPDPAPPGRQPDPASPGPQPDRAPVATQPDPPAGMGSPRRGSGH